MLLVVSAYGNTSLGINILGLNGLIVALSLDWFGPRDLIRLQGGAIVLIEVGQVLRVFGIAPIDGSLNQWIRPFSCNRCGWLTPSEALPNGESVSVRSKEGWRLEGGRNVLHRGISICSALGNVVWLLQYSKWGSVSDGIYDSRSFKFAIRTPD